MWLSVLALLTLGGYLAFERYWYYLPGLALRLIDPIGPTLPVTWQEGPAARSPGERPPNVVVILADDLGWNDLTFNGGGVAGRAVPTPRIDSIGRDGVTYTMAFAGNATCAPSRAAIMTGRYATRFGFEFTPVPRFFARFVGNSPTGSEIPRLYNRALANDVPMVANDLAVPASEVMIGEVMRTRGYHTLMIGKWHLGGVKSARPEQRGFDEALSFYEGASMYLPAESSEVENSRQEFDPIDKFLWANPRFGLRYNGGPHFAPGAYMTDYLGDQAVHAITANRNRPFFLYLAFNAPHSPLQALKSDYNALPGISDHRLRVYGAMIRALDRNVGKVLDALKAQGLEDNTLVIFTSDNGGAYYLGLTDINKPFRGWKETFFEGGLHVPFFMKWPARLARGLMFRQPVGHVDIFATAAGAANAALPAGRVLDGTDLVDYAGHPERGAPHKALYWRSGTYKVVLAGLWKLQVSERPARTWLFNLAEDPTEQKNLAEEMPQKVSELHALLAEIDAQQAKPLWPAVVEDPIFIDHPEGEPAKPGDDYVYWPN